MVKKYYRVDVTQGIRGGKKRYSVSTVHYNTNSIKSALNKAKRESFRSRQKIPKKYNLYYDVMEVK